MSKVLIAYGTDSGNTELVADWIFDVFLEHGHDTDIVNCKDTKAEGLCTPYDLILLGCPTYGCDEIDIQEDFEIILNDLETSGISGKKVAIFGLGDDIYPHFCGAVDVIEERVKACGAHILCDSIKINDPFNTFKDQIIEWAKKTSELIPI